MSKEVIEMINNGEISVEEFFLLHPHSAIENLQYKSALIDVDCWDTFQQIYSIFCRTTPPIQNSLNSYANYAIM